MSEQQGPRTDKSEPGLDETVATQPPVIKRRPASSRPTRPTRSLRVTSPVESDVFALSGFWAKGVSDAWILLTTTISGAA